MLAPWVPGLWSPRIPMSLATAPPEDHLHQSRPSAPLLLWQAAISSNVAGAGDIPLLPHSCRRHCSKQWGSLLGGLQTYSACSILQSPQERCHLKWSLQRDTTSDTGRSLAALDQTGLVSRIYKVPQKSNNPSRPTNKWSNYLFTVLKRINATS